MPCTKKKSTHKVTFNRVGDRGGGGGTASNVGALCGGCGSGGLALDGGNVRAGNVRRARRAVIGSHRTMFLDQVLG
jgi:hypothetical protein